MARLHRSIVLLVIVFASAACASAPSTPAVAPAATSPLAVLLAGNRRFVHGRPTHVQQAYDQRPALVQGQHPIAIIVCCSDSRVPPELVFDQGLGRLFVVRLAGEVVDANALGSIEYATEHLHTHLIVVLGHDQCGAVQAAIAAGQVPGHIESIVRAIQPAVAEARTQPGNLLDNAINDNILHVVSQIKSSRPILAHLVDTGQLQVVGARYNLASGRVVLLPD